MSRADITYLMSEIFSYPRYRAILAGAKSTPHVLTYTGNAYDLLQKFQESNKCVSPSRCLA